MIFCVLTLVSISASAAVGVFSVESATFGDSNTPLSDTVADAPEISRSDLITVKVNTVSAGSSVMLVAVKESISLENITDDDLVAFDEVYSDNNNVAEISFRVKLTAPAGTYALYIGGTDAADAHVVKYFKLAQPASTYLSGDVDASEVVDSTDAVYILRHSLGLSVPATVVIEAGDVDASESVDSTDAVYILRYSLGLSVPSNVTVGEQVSQ